MRLELPHFTTTRMKDKILSLYYYTRAGNVRQAYFEIYPFRAPYCKSTVENCKSFGAARIEYVRYNISKDLSQDQFFC